MSSTLQPTRRDRCRRWLSAAALALAATCMAAAPSHAQSDDEDLPDARLMGYGNNVTANIEGSTTTSYLLTIILGAICVGVMFKNSGRTHLD